MIQTQLIDPYGDFLRKEDKTHPYTQEEPSPGMNNRARS